ncbi:hypothetical protein BLD44_017760 [Mastigocladus laminosus UU774]|nr:hypothetical protein BLD44_017760 [Mastigocladus laminosus UU774]
MVHTSLDSKHPNSAKVAIAQRIGHWAWGMGHWAWGMGHWAWGTDLLNNSPHTSPTSRRDSSRLYITPHTSHTSHTPVSPFPFFAHF